MAAAAVCGSLRGVMSLQCEPTQRWRRENEDDVEGGRQRVVVVVGMKGWSFEGCTPSSPTPLVPRRLDRSEGLNLPGSLAGLHAQLLPVGRLLRLGLGARVGAPVERRHSAAFGIGVQAAVGRRVAGLELGGALHLLQSTDYTWRQRETRRR